MTPSTLSSEPGPSASGVERGRGPDFICMGLMKAGTQWLYDQLQHHPDFWMPPYKELHYFDRPFPGGRIRSNAERLMANPDLAAKKQVEHNDRPLDERDNLFFRQVIDFSAKRRDLAAYRALFEPAGDLLTGDITPGYSILKKKMVKRLSRRFEDAKVVMMLRDPVSRLWSQWNMRHLLRGDSEAEGLDLQAFSKFAGKRFVVQRSYPSKIAEPWQKFFGARFRYFFLDDVIERPDQTRAAVLEHLGARQMEPAMLPPDFNRKEKEKSLRRTPEIQAFMRERFAEEREACARLFGGAALKWPDAPY